MQRAPLSPHGGHRGLLREVHQASLLQHVRQEREQGLIGTQDFAYQHEAQYGCIRLITMGTGRMHTNAPLYRTPLTGTVVHLRSPQASAGM